MKAMKDREQIKTEIRFYKRFLEEMEAEMDETTTYARLQEITTRYGIPLEVLNQLVFTRIIIGENTSTKEMFELYEDQESDPCDFEFGEEVDYRLANYLRVETENHIKLYKYYRSETCKSLIDEVATEDEVAFQTTKFLIEEADEIKSESHLPNKIGTTNCDTIEIKLPEWLKKFVSEIFK